MRTVLATSNIPDLGLADLWNPVLTLVTIQDGKQVICSRGWERYYELLSTLCFIASVHAAFQQFYPLDVQREFNGSLSAAICSRVVWILITPLSTLMLIIFFSTHFFSCCFHSLSSQTVLDTGVVENQDLRVLGFWVCFNICWDKQQPVALLLMTVVCQDGVYTAEYINSFGLQVFFEFPFPWLLVPLWINTHAHYSWIHTSSKQPQAVSQVKAASYLISVKLLLSSCQIK